MPIEEWGQEKCVATTTNLSTARDTGVSPKRNANRTAATTRGDARAAVPRSFEDEWAERHNEEIWGAGPDGTYRWRDQADGFYERGE
jgi:hypothetical protein